MNRTVHLFFFTIVASLSSLTQTSEKPRIEIKSRGTLQRVEITEVSSKQIIYVAQHKAQGTIYYTKVEQWTTSNRNSYKGCTSLCAKPLCENCAERISVIKQPMPIFAQYDEQWKGTPPDTSCCSVS